MSEKFVPEMLVENALDATVAAYKKVLPLVAGRQRLNEDINLTIINEFTVVQTVIDGLIQNARRRLKSLQLDATPVQVDVVPESIETVVTDSLNSESKPEEITFTILDRGRAFKGTRTVRVPVTMRPMMHMSQGGRWSWRTMVEGHSDFRHVNVTNFHSSEVDNFGNLYAIVDAEWVTDQPVFKDLCNQLPVNADFAL